MNLKLTVSLLMLLLVLPCVAHSQTPAPTPTPAPSPPASEIFVASLDARGDSLKVGAPKSITTWRGYNNQPSFLSDGRALLYTSIRADGQADIYRHDLHTGDSMRLTETTESEYSPTQTPDGRFFSVIRVERDGTQRLWKFPLGGGQPTLVLERIKPVGYHAWIDARRLALFVLGEPNTLQLADTRTQQGQTLAQNIGRSIHRVPRSNRFSFVHKVSESEWLIKTYDTRTRAIETLVRTLPASEDYAWTPRGVLLMAKDSKLFQLDPVREREWREVADFAAQGIGRITRIAVSRRGDRVAFVVQR
ncbi:MAG TPA: hypothetical protein VGV59_06365 [Pyrinomonadaceae bacterium]|nr:hypothetical protein [Pyrinomonadaceae bacterium]